MTCIQTLSQVKDSPAVTDIFLHDTKAAYAKMVAAEEVPLGFIAKRAPECSTVFVQKKTQEAAAKEIKTVAIQVDDTISFRQFSKKSGVDGLDDVCLVYLLNSRQS